MQTRARIALEGFGVPESLRWHDNALWFCDLAHGTVHRWDTASPVETVLSVPGRAGGLGWLPDGRLLVVSMDERCVYRQEHDGTLVEHADLRAIAHGPVNDMLVDDLGRAYVGNFGFDYHGYLREHANSMLYAPPGPPGARVACVAADGSLIGVTEPLLFPNGAVARGDSFVIAESLGMRLTEFTVQADGMLANPRTWASLISSLMWRAVTHPGLLGRVTRRVSVLLDHPAIAARSSSPIAPDGIAEGADGSIWVANALRGECVRVARGGRVLDRVPTSQHTLSCLQVGRQLFAGTVSTDDPVRAAQVNRGRIEVHELS